MDLPKDLLKLTHSYLSPGEQWYLGTKGVLDLGTAPVPKLVLYLEDLLREGHGEVVDKLLKSNSEHPTLLPNLIRSANIGISSLLQEYFLNDLKYHILSLLNAGFLGSVQGGNLEQVQLYLSLTPIDAFEFALFITVEYHQPQVFRFLLEKYSFPEIRDLLPPDVWERLFFYAASLGNSRMMNLIPIGPHTIAKTEELKIGFNHPQVRHWLSRKWKFRDTLNGELLRIIGEEGTQKFEIDNLLMLGADAVGQSYQKAREGGHSKWVEYLEILISHGSIEEIRGFLDR